MFNKYQQQQDKERCRQEERSRRDENHWRNEGLRLPSTADCPECCGMKNNRYNFKRQRYDNRDHWPIIKDRRDRDRIPIHDRLGARVEEQDIPEDEANARVPNKGLAGRGSEHHDEYRYDPEKCPQWCTRGLTHYQKRRVQRLRHREQEEDRAREEKPVKS